MMNERMLGATRIRLSRRGFATLARASVMTFALFGSGCGDPIEVTPQTEAMAAPRQRVYYIAAEGREATLYRVEPGGTCLLSLTSTIDRAAFPAWVDAGPDGGQYVRVPSDTLHRLIDTESAVRQFVLGALSGRVFDLMCALEELGSSQVEQRVARFLLRRCEADDCVRISQVGIASELGTAREVVFRALRSLSAQNLVQTGRMKIRIIDRDGLRRAASLVIPA